MADVSLDSDDVELWIKSTGEVLRYWAHYSFNGEFLTPTDAWSFSVGDERIITALYPKIPPGTLVSLVINGKTQATGTIDKRRINTHISKL